MRWLLLQVAPSPAPSPCPACGLGAPGRPAARWDRAEPLGDADAGAAAPVGGGQLGAGPYSRDTAFCRGTAAGRCGAVRCLLSVGAASLVAFNCI